MTTELASTVRYAGTQRCGLSVSGWLSDAATARMRAEQFATPTDWSNQRIDSATAERTRGISYAAVLVAKDETTVALDEHGNLVEYLPDRTSTLLATSGEVNSAGVP